MIDEYDIRNSTPDISLAIAWKAPPSTRIVIGSTSTRSSSGGPGCFPSSYSSADMVTPPGSSERLPTPRSPSPRPRRRPRSRCSRDDRCGPRSRAGSRWSSRTGSRSPGPRADSPPGALPGRSTGSETCSSAASTRNQASPSKRSASSGDSPPASISGVESWGIRPMPRTRMFGTSMSESSNRREYSRSWMSWKSLRSVSTQACVDRPGPTSTRSSYP